ncbi:MULTISPECIES: metal-sensitive transcriptional regulator [Paenisporosarcina]|uniref:Metal-sensitive transcriptional regulator n=1 Tax=Paenisporosarcina antarctica TaxID=417367 RepID=A0A4P6ZZ67_9BACL|nr:MULTISPECIES: metal-sensitive transcriptional regulator [Paenisporosarcina]QBP41737.1 metal-sensitive transcriptional regulator [Paenisporosarcina antarctica]
MDYSKQITNRLNRVDGQLHGVLRMLEDARECTDVVTQLSAIKGALDRTIGLIVSENLERCVRTSIAEGHPSDEHVKQAVQLLMRSR